MENKKIKIRGLGEIKSFEDLEAYKLARTFRKRIYELIGKLPKDEQYNLSSQMRRAAVSLTNNIAEGYGRYHYQENMQFCRQSRGSLCELLDYLNVCLDEDYISKGEYLSYRKDAFHLLKELNGYISRTKELQENYKRAKIV